MVNKKVSLWEPIMFTAFAVTSTYGMFADGHSLLVAWAAGFITFSALMHWLRYFGLLFKKGDL